MSLIKILQADYPQFTFKQGDDFHWHPDENAVYYKELSSSTDKLMLLHELAHAILGHSDYDQDIELITMETKAWQLVEDELARKYNVEFDVDLAEDQLDSYRDWLHKRSLCPNCNINGFQIDKNTYKCPACGQKWKVNQAKFTQLRRRIVDSSN